MPGYIRAYVPGGTFFFTVALLERHRRLLSNHIEALRVAFAGVQVHADQNLRWGFRRACIDAHDEAAQ